MTVTLDPYFLQVDSADFLWVYPDRESGAVHGGGDGSIDPVTLDVGEREHPDLFVSVCFGADAIEGTVTVQADATA